MILASSHIASLPIKGDELYDPEEICRLIEALASKNIYWLEHSVQIGSYCIALARAIGLGLEEERNICLSAYFHDIGKILIPAEILNKRGKLTDEEYELMKRHAELGALLLDPAIFPQAVIDAVRHHHEWWDGSGYPSGLKCLEIPLGSRILSIVDAYHAMVTDRPYRKGLPVEEAIRRLRESAGTQFDPELVDLFASLIADIPPSK